LLRTIGRMEEELPADVRAYVDGLAAEVSANFAALDPNAFYEIDLSFSEASTERLRQYWEHGKGGTVTARWGTPGSMKRCIAANRTHMTDPGGYCALRHKRATGQWPTEGGKAGIPS
jgi:hypothetical protein